MMEILIEKGIPIPPRRRGGGGRRRKYNFAVMDVGDSFRVDCCLGNTVTTAAVRHMRQTGTLFESRTIADGIRIWRMR